MKIKKNKTFEYQFWWHKEAKELVNVIGEVTLLTKNLPEPIKCYLFIAQNIRRYVTPKEEFKRDYEKLNFQEAIKRAQAVIVEEFSKGPRH